MKKTIMILAVASTMAACAGSSNTEANDSTAVAVDSVVVANDTTSSGGNAAPTIDVK